MGSSRTSSEVVRGSIKHNDEVIVSNVEIQIKHTESLSGFQDWAGWFDAPADTVIQPDEHYLELEDGRSARILIKRWERSSTETHVSVWFRGMEPLA